MNIVKHFLPFLLIASILTTLRSAEPSDDSDEPSPVGCYRLKTEDYARLRRGPYEDMIFYILTWPELKGGKPLKSGDYAGKVAIGRLEYALIKK